MSASAPGIDHVGARPTGDGVGMGAAGDGEAVALGAEIDDHAGRGQRRRHRLDVGQVAFAAALRPAEVAASVSVSVPSPPSTVSAPVKPTMVSAPAPALMTSRRRRR